MDAGLMPFREAARRLRSMATEARDVARQLELGHGADGWAIGRDVNALAASLDRYADFALRMGANAGEPSDEDAAWIAAAAPGELVELYGK